MSFGENQSDLIWCRDPIGDSMLPLEHHFLRTAAATPLRLFSEMDMDNNNLMNSIEKARMLQQQWGSRAVAAALGGYPGGGGGPGGNGGGGGDQSSLHHLLAAAANPSLPQLFTLNHTRGSPSPHPLPAHLWSQWSALSQLPPGFIVQSQNIQQHQHHLAQQQQNHQSQNTSSSGIGGTRSEVTRSPSSNRFTPYPSPMSAKGASTSPTGSIPPSSLINESSTIGVTTNSSRS